MSHIKSAKSISCNANNYDNSNNPNEDISSNGEKIGLVKKLSIDASAKKMPAKSAMKNEKQVPIYKPIAKKMMKYNDNSFEYQKNLEAAIKASLEDVTGESQLPNKNIVKEINSDDDIFSSLSEEEEVVEDEEVGKVEEETEEEILEELEELSEEMPVKSKGKKMPIECSSEEEMPKKSPIGYKSKGKKMPIECSSEEEMPKKSAKYSSEEEKVPEKSPAGYKSKGKKMPIEWLSDDEAIPSKTIAKSKYVSSSSEEEVIPTKPKSKSKYVFSSSEEEMPVKSKPKSKANVKEIDDLLEIEEEEIPEHIFKEELYKILQEPEIFKRNFKHYISLINSDTFNEEKLSIMQSENVKGNYVIPLPIYKYSEKILDPLLIQTSFFDVKKNKLSYKNNKIYQKKNIDSKNIDPKNNDDLKHFEIKFDPTFIDSQIINILLNFDNKLVKFIKNTFGDQFKCLSKMIYNKSAKKLTPDFEIVNMADDLGEIKAKILKSKCNKQYNKIINYNISKKYAPVEYFDLANIKNSDLSNIFDRILADNKEMRMLIEPFAWINLSNKTYGSYLNIMMIEVKYKNAKIYSMLDKNEISMKPEIINIEI